MRDALMGKPCTDLDFATVLPPQTVRERLEATGYRVIDTGITHGTVTVLIDGSPVEVTTFRTPGPRSGSAFSDSIQTDLAGRDFTINAIAVAIDSGTLVDPFSGQADLAAKILRGVGVASERFEEDPLRILRLLRFKAAYNFEIAPETYASAQTLVSQLRSVSVERVRDEFVKLLCATNPVPALRDMVTLGIMDLIIPEAIPSVGFEQNEFHQHDVFEHTIHVVAESENSPLLRLTAFFHDLGKPHTLSVDDDGRRHFYKHELSSEGIAEAVMERLKFSKDQISDVSTLVRLHMRPLDCGAAGIRRLMRDLGPLLDPWMSFKVSDASVTRADKTTIAQQLTGFKNLVATERARTKGSVYGRLAIDGNDLVKLGVKPGKVLGDILRTLDQMVLDNPELNDREQLLERARGLVNGGKS